MDLDLVAGRRCVLASAVIDGVEALPDDRGVVVSSPTAEATVAVSWSEVADAIGTQDPDGPAARRRLTRWLRLRLALALDPDVRTRMRPVGLPFGHVLHPGPGWVRAHVLGGAVEVGLGAVGLLDDPDEVLVLPHTLLQAAGYDDRPWWPDLARYIDEMGAVAAGRYRSDPRGALRPIGDCDVITLLASRLFRAALCADDPIGLRTAAVPMRRRGWLDLSRIDPAFAVAAAAATRADERGFERPILISADEVLLSRPGGAPGALALKDPSSTRSPIHSQETHITRTATP